MVGTKFEFYNYSCVVSGSDKEQTLKCSYSERTSSTSIVNAIKILCIWFWYLNLIITRMQRVNVIKYST